MLLLLLSFDADRSTTTAVFTASATANVINNVNATHQ